jgi:hypothetical protein
MPALTFTALALLLAPPRLTRTNGTRDRDRDVAKATRGSLIPPATLPRPRIPAPAPKPVPAPVPRSVPAPAGPVRVDPDGPPLCGPQAQGDVIVLPWMDCMRPDIRAAHALTARPIGRRGLVVHPTHALRADVGTVWWAWWPGQSSTLGTLVVPDGAVARLSHPEHGDLRIGPGVYAVRRQRHGELRGSTLVED